MPLSEQEQRLLEEMERGLYSNDADFVATVSGHRGAPDYRMIVLGTLIAVAGIVGIVVGVATKLPIIGVIGFVVMFGGVLLALRRTKSSGPAPESDRSPSPARAGFMDRMNERWDRRQDGRDV